MGLPHGQSPHRIAVQFHFRYSFCMFDTDIRVYRTLVNPEEHLFGIQGIFQGIQPRHLLFAALQPSGGAFCGCLYVAAVRLAGGALVKGHRDGGSQIGLDLHTFLWSHEDPASVYVGVKIDPLLLDFAQSCQRKNLKSAGVSQDGPVPGHELMESPQLPDHLITRAHMEMIGIGQLHLGLNLLQIGCGHGSLDSPHRPHIHKHRCLNGAVNGFQNGPLGPSLLL